MNFYNILHSIQCTHRHTILQPAGGGGCSRGAGWRGASSEVSLRTDRGHIAPRQHRTQRVQGTVQRSARRSFCIMVISEALGLRFGLLNILFPSISININRSTLKRHIWLSSLCYSGEQTIGITHVLSFDGRMKWNIFFHPCSNHLCSHKTIVKHENLRTNSSYP